MTCLTPPALVVVPSLLALALPAARGLPLVVSGGQPPAQAPEQCEVEPWSPSNR